MSRAFVCLGVLSQTLLYMMAEPWGCWAIDTRVLAHMSVPSLGRLTARNVRWWGSLATITAHTWTRPKNQKNHCNVPWILSSSAKTAQAVQQHSSHITKSGRHGRSRSLCLKPQLLGRVTWAQVSGSSLGIGVMTHLKKWVCMYVVFYSFTCEDSLHICLPVIIRLRLKHEYWDHRK